MKTQLVSRIAVLVVLISLAGSVMTAQADNLLIDASQANGGDFSVYLPVVLNDPFVPDCPDFFDDFSDPASGWFVGEDNRMLAEYLNGEYRVLVKRTNWSQIINAPACKQKNYTVEVDARWAGSDNMGVSYGLMFSTTDSPTQYYFFEVKADKEEEGEYTVSHYGQGGWETIIESEVSSLINTGTASNKIKVTHQGSLFTAFIDGVYLDSWNDTTEPGEQGVGLIIYSYPHQGDADARFDNFRVTKLSE